jgi:hypothetical protein
VNLVIKDVVNVLDPQNVLNVKMVFYSEENVMLVAHKDLTNKILQLVYNVYLVQLSVKVVTRLITAKVVILDSSLFQLKTVVYKIAL